MGLRILTTFALVILTIFPTSNATPVSSPNWASDTPVIVNSCSECRFKYVMAFYDRANCSLWLQCNEEGTHCGWGNNCDKDGQFVSVRLDGKTIYWYATWYGDKWDRPSSAVSTLEKCGEVRQVLHYGARVYDPYWACDRYVCEKWGCYSYYDWYYDWWSDYYYRGPYDSCCEWKCESYSYGCHGGLYLEGKCYRGGEWVALMIAYTEPRRQ